MAATERIGRADTADYRTPPTSAGVAEPPDWASHALGRERRMGRVVCDGVTIRYLSWGDPAAPATVLVHGGAAHAMWWAPLAALLDHGGHVVALDLSGHGLSDHRPVYSVGTWAREVVAVAEAVSPDPATIVAHSLGGIASSVVLTDPALAEHVRRVVLVDTPAWPDAPAPEQPLAEREVRPHRIYAAAAEGVARFRLVPPQPCDNDWYVDHIAWHGLRPVDEPHAPAAGVQWRFDPRIFANPTGNHQIVRFGGDLDEACRPFAVVMGERSYLAEGARRALAGRPDTPLLFVPDAAHHVMLDQPLSLLSTLRSLLTTWP
ncbi:MULTISPECIES: alpha/beta fold hydrolase [Prauserella salsuginis group]|uniref:Alpha/beta fold hydrolase n=1 Tax=Prauserella salsuginis TaxID=387889 RepID=A0ABW6G4W0_9PSEU|nr:MULTISPECIES: alpha/beta hydrolase [Prauserella salsuginis group]MCR3718776.1 Pimeloyl-ACP methyl ester carboxylesterase [Prauserella flava]MCR3733346.1 Pimeloyl-ACP methyl ester carboxylesterase [Prauserella salsuginis]